METRANYVWVGAVSLVLLALLAAFIIWLAQLGTANRKEYDIFFPQSVGGLANGSEVTFQGVPAGQVNDIELWTKDPSFVRVRVSLDPEIPILQGTTATISASFTGVSTISLGGAVRGAPPITEPGPEGVPVIPAERGGLGEILASAPLLLERLATLTDRLSRMLSDENQASITGILRNTDRMSAELASMAPEMRATLRELQGTLAQSTETLDAFEGTLRSTDNLLNQEGQSLAQELRTTLRSAQQADHRTKLHSLQLRKPIVTVANPCIAGHRAHIRAAEVLHHHLQDLRFGNRIGVHHQDQIAFRAGNGIVQRHRLALIKLLVKKSNARIRKKRLYTFYCPVFGAVVDDDNFVVRIVDARQTPQRRGDAGLFVVGRRQNADKRRERIVVGLFSQVMPVEIRQRRRDPDQAGHDRVDAVKLYRQPVEMAFLDRLNQPKH